jgi:hypothetical protein
VIDKMKAQNSGSGQKAGGYLFVFGRTFKLAGRMIVRYTKRGGAVL